MVEIQGVVVRFWVLGVLLHCRVNACQMNMDTILSASADQTIRLWSAKSLRCTEEYRVHGEKTPIIDVDFDENKV
jgi:WD40 repeat protein